MSVNSNFRDIPKGRKKNSYANFIRNNWTQKIPDEVACDDRCH